ncbi:nucleoside-diphosphate kinase [Chloroflexota bacterium]
MEKSLVLVKPDAVAQGHTGAIVARLEAEGLKLKALKMIQMDKSLAERHYGIHRDKPFFGELVTYITSGPVTAMVLEAEGAIEKIRGIMGATDPKKAAPGTIRAEYGIDIQSNATHASDGPDTAKQEVALFFTAEELVG